VEVPHAYGCIFSATDEVTPYPCCASVWSETHPCQTHGKVTRWDGPSDLIGRIRELFSAEQLSPGGECLGLPALAKQNPSLSW
jgi:hypothetical protein